MHHNHTEGHVCKCTTSSVSQTLDEMDWERGIWYAALLGDKIRVSELLQKDGAAKATDNAGYTALHYAARSGHVDICKILLDRGVDVNAQTKSGRATPLHRAAAAGHCEVVSLLLSRGAAPDSLDADQQTPLHRAAEFNHTDVMSQLVITATMLKDMKDKNGNTAFDILLLRHGTQFYDDSVE